MRKIIQYYPETKYERPAALCDDGTLWGISSINEWEQFPEIPQDVPTERNKENDQRSDYEKPILLLNGEKYRLCGMRRIHSGDRYITENGKYVVFAARGTGAKRMIVEEI